MTARRPSFFQWADPDCVERVAGSLRGLAATLVRPNAPPAPEDAVDWLEHLLLRGAYADALAFCSASGPDIANRLFLPVIHRLEARWKVDDAGFADLAFAFFQLRRLIEMTSAPATPARMSDGPGGRVLVALAEGEEHGFGAQLVAAELGARGLSVDLDLTGNSDTVRRKIADHRYDVLGLSVGHDDALDGLADFIAEARLVACAPNLSVVVGGAALAEPREQYHFLGADAIALTADEAVRWLTAHLATLRPLIRN